MRNYSAHRMRPEKRPVFLGVVLVEHQLREDEDMGRESVILNWHKIIGERVGEQMTYHR